MMAIRNILLQSAGVLVGAVLLSACNRTPVVQENTTTESKPQTQAVSQEPGVRVPIVLNLRGPVPTPTSGDITIAVEVDASMAPRVPAELKVNLPDGVKLVSGQASETLQITAPGKTQREFVVHTDAPLAKPVSFTLDLKDPKGAFGLHAERLYPEPAGSPVRASTLRPPMPRPPQAP